MCDWIFNERWNPTDRSVAERTNERRGSGWRVPSGSQAAPSSSSGLDLPFMMMPHPLLPMGLPPASVAMAMSQMNHLSTIANMAAAAQQIHSHAHRAPVIKVTLKIKSFSCWFLNTIKSFKQKNWTTSKPKKFFVMVWMFMGEDESPTNVVTEKPSPRWTRPACLWPDSALQQSTPDPIRWRRLKDDPDASGNAVRHGCFNVTGFRLTIMSVQKVSVYQNTVIQLQLELGEKCTIWKEKRCKIIESQIFTKILK